MNAKISTASRLFLGLIYFVFGLNGFLNFIPAPSPPESVMKFMDGVMTAVYFFPLLKGTEVICGLLLLLNLASPLALVILAPITLQIFFFHAFLTPGASNLILPIVMIVLHLLAAKAFWPKYRPLFSAK